MNSIKFALLSFRKNSVSLIIVILELAALLFIENYTVCTIKERGMLNSPYSGIMTENCAFVFDSDRMMKMAYENITEQEAQTKLLEGISGDYTVYDILSYPSSELAIISVSDEIYSKLTMPLSLGKYGTAVGTSDMVVGNKTVLFNDGTQISIDISGILTTQTYIPCMNLGVSSGGTISDFYNPVINAKNTIITNRSSIIGYEENFTPDMGFLISFQSDFEKNMRLLQSRAMVIPATAIAKNSEEALNADINTFVPLIIIVMATILIGITCISLIAWQENKRRNGVLWLCGFSRMKIVVIHGVEIILQMILSLTVSIAVFETLKAAGNEYIVGMQLSLENLAVIILTFAVILIFALIFPILASLNTSPVQYIRRCE